MNRILIAIAGRHKKVGESSSSAAATTGGGMEFCPTCGNLLNVQPPADGRRTRLACPTCPYYANINNKLVKRHFLSKKEVEPIFSGEDALQNAPKTEANCPACGNGQAYFRQMQIRSADEPMTTFYKCCACTKEWRED